MNLYKVNTDEGNKKKFAMGIQVTLSTPPIQEIHCSSCGIHSRRIVHEEWRHKNEFVLTNYHYPDFMFSSDGLLISERAVKILNKEKISGYKYEEIQTISPKEAPIEFQRLLREAGEKISKMPENPPIYYRIRFTGTINLHDTTNVEILNCEVCGIHRLVTAELHFISPSHQLFLNLSSWNGDDLMNINALGVKVCSSRFFELYVQYELTGLCFTKFPGK